MLGERGRLERATWMVGGLVVSFVALIVLGIWFPVWTWFFPGWVIVVFLDYGTPTAPWRPAPWYYPSVFAIMFSGLGLLFGAASGSPPRDHVGVGAVIGTVCFVVGTAVAVIGQRRFSARAVDEEIERFRREEGERVPGERD